jgi:hypothetical protein
MSELFYVNFNVNFKIVSKTIQLCIGWWVKNIDNVLLNLDNVIPFYMFIYFTIIKTLRIIVSYFINHVHYDMFRSVIVTIIRCCYNYTKEKN